MAKNKYSFEKRLKEIAKKKKKEAKRLKKMDKNSEEGQTGQQTLTDDKDTHVDNLV
jgi:hypothetical protein